MKKFLGLVSGLMTLSALAELPLFSIVGSPPISFNTTYSYVVTNNATYALNNIGLLYAPTGLTPQGFVQITSGANACTNPFNLGAGASCNLYYQIDPTQLVNNLAVGGPEICYNVPHPIYCSVPDTASQINISYKAPSTIVGQFLNGSATNSILIENYQPGSPWLTGVASSLLTSVNTIVLSSNACNESLCVASGIEDIISPASTQAFLIYSLDNGLTWINNVFSPEFPALLFTACAQGFQGHCIGYANIFSTNSFTVYNFNYTSLPPAWQPNFTGGGADVILESGACGDYCVVLGAEALTSKAILYSSSPTLASWTTFTPTLSISGSAYIAAYCDGSFCLALGDQFLNLGLGILSYPVVSQSNDGISWNVIDLSLTVGPFAPATSNNNATLSCAGSFCVAGGKNSSTNASKLIQSFNQGTSWTEVTSVTPLPSGTFSNVSCASSICIAVQHDTSNHYFLWQTRDQGLIWTPIPLVLNSTTAITVGRCSDDICFVAGVDGATSNTVVYQTINAGQTWLPATLSPTVPSHVFSMTSGQAQ